MDSQRFRDFFLLLGALAIPACTERDPDGDKPTPRSVCEAYGDRLLACYAEEENVEQYAEEYTEYCLSYLEELEADAPDCADAMVDYYACLSELECTAFEGEEAPCSEFEAPIEEACDGQSVDSDPSGEGGDSGDQEDGG